MLAQTHFGLAKGPVFVAHQAENGQQLRLGKLTLAETASVAWEHRPGDLQSDAGKRQESDFGHRTSCLHREPRGGQSPSQISMELRGCQQSQMTSGHESPVTHFCYIILAAASKHLHSTATGRFPCKQPPFNGSANRNSSPPARP